MTSTNPRQPDQRAAAQPARPAPAPPADRAKTQNGHAPAVAANPHEEHVPEEEAGYGYGV